MALISSAGKRKLIKELALMLQRRPGPLLLVAKFPLIKGLSRFYVAGDSIADAISVAKKLRAEGKLATLDLLGEEVKSKAEAHKIAYQYRQMLHAISDNNLQRYTDVSLKLTQLGLNIGKNFCLTRLRKLLHTAKRKGITVWVDMEDHRYTNATVEIVEQLRPKYPNLRAVLQSMMHSSNSHAERLVKLGTTIRLCKGAYKEPPELAYQHRLGDIRENFIRIIDQTLFRQPAVYHGIATHDEAIIEQTIKLMKKHGLSKNDFEFQMLYGVKKELQDKLVKEGYRLRLYIPFGRYWLPYLLRRVAENPDIVDDFSHDIVERIHREHGIDLKWLHPYLKIR